jgi:hypothetical protein
MSCHRLLPILALIGSATLGGCGSAANDAADGCRPPTLRVNTPTAAPRQTVTPSADPAPCDQGDLAATYQIFLLTEGRQAPVELGQAHADASGAFSVDLTVPAVAPGAATLDVRGSVLDRGCADTSRKCAGYSVPLTIGSEAG